MVALFLPPSFRRVYLDTVYSLIVFSSFTGPVSLTIPAHRLMTKAYEVGGAAAQSALFSPIFRAYYEDDLDISDPDVLADVAEEAGIMSKDEVSSMRGCKLVSKSNAEYWFFRHWTL